MLTLYHSASSSNSQRVRIALVEKGLPWQSHLLASGEQHSEHFRAISPSGTVPALVHNGCVLKDSVVINEYLEDCFPRPALRPSEPCAVARVRQWTKHADDYLQQSIAVFTHALCRRPVVLDQHNGDLDKALAQIDDPIILRSRRSVYADGLASPYAQEALHLITASLVQIHEAVQTSDWLVENTYSLADIALLPAIYRLECLAMNFLWTDNLSGVESWLQRGKARASFQTAVNAYLSEETMASYRTSGMVASDDLLKLHRSI